MKNLLVLVAAIVLMSCEKTVVEVVEQEVIIPKITGTHRLLTSQYDDNVYEYLNTTLTFNSDGTGYLIAGTFDTEFWYYYTDDDYVMTCLHANSIGSKLSNFTVITYDPLYIQSGNVYYTFE